MSNPIYTAAQLDQAASDLNSCAGALTTYADDIERILNATGTSVADVFNLWHGPRADDELGRAEAFLASVDGTADAVNAQADIIEQLATRTEQYAGELRTAERRRDAAAAVLGSGFDHYSEAAVIQAAGDTAQADAEIASLSAEWSGVAARTLSGWSFSTGITALNQAHNAATAELAGEPIAEGDAYRAVIVRLAATEGIDLDVLDPTGATWTWSRGTAYEILTGPAGPILLLALETAKQQDASKADQYLSADDLDAVLEMGVLRRGHVVDALVRTGTVGYLNDSDIDTLTSLLTASAWLLRASWDDDLSAAYEAQMQAWFPDGGSELAAPEEALPNLPPSLVGGLADHGAVGAGGVEGVDLGPLPVSAAAKPGVDLLTEDSPMFRRAVGAASTGLAFLSVVEACADGGNCGAAIAETAIDTVGGAAFPIAYPTAKFLVFSLGNAYAGLQEQTPSVSPVWAGHNNIGGILPHEAARLRYAPPDQIYPDGYLPPGSRMGR